MMFVGTSGMTVAGIEKLRRAGEILRRDGDGSATPLLSGASEVWSAMFELPTWPRELRDRAVDLQNSLFRYGPIRTTVGQMVEPERLQLRRELLAFVESAERFDAAPASELVAGE